MLRVIALVVAGVLVKVFGLDSRGVAVAIALFDWRALVRFFRIQHGELLVSVTAMVGVVALGALQGIALAVALAILFLLIRSSRPAIACSVASPDGRDSSISRITKTRHPCRG